MTLLEVYQREKEILFNSNYVEQFEEEILTKLNTLYDYEVCVKMLKGLGSTYTMACLNEALNLGVKTNIVCKEYHVKKAKDYINKIEGLI